MRRMLQRKAVYEQNTFLHILNTEEILFYFKHNNYEIRRFGHPLCQSCVQAPFPSVYIL